MKKSLVLLLLIPTISFCQKINSTECADSRNIYNDAIKQYLLNVAKTDTLKIDTLIIEKNEAFTDSLQTNIAGTFLQILDWTEIKAKLNKQESLIVNRLFPLEFDKGRFIIYILPLNTTMSSDSLNLVNGGSCNIIYSFDSNLKRFKFIKVSCWAL